jgi:hypothetical protein
MSHTASPALFVSAKEETHNVRLPNATGAPQTPLFMRAAIRLSLQVGLWPLRLQAEIRQSVDSLLDSESSDTRIRVKLALQPHFQHEWNDAPAEVLVCLDPNGTVLK